MKEIYLVTPEDQYKALQMREKLLSTAPEGGILFTSIKVQPASEMSPDPIFEIVIGCHETSDVMGVELFARYALKSFGLKDRQLAIKAFRGLSR